MLFGLILALAVQPAAVAPESIEGTWRSPGGNSIVTIAPCGDSLCGTVAWASAKAKKDSAKTTGQLVGTQLLTGLKRDKKGRWQGKLFIPDKDMRVTAKIERISGDQLKVSGCALGKSLCKAAQWTRVEGPLPDQE
jgi:uncharacterized protein (DUF2147 family)